MNAIQKSMRKNTLIQIFAGVLLYFLIQKKEKSPPKLTVGDVIPDGKDYVSEYFKDSEYFGQNKIPTDYYGNWLKLAKELDKIRKAFGTAILIKKGFNISESVYASCKAVEIYPQNNDYKRLMEVVQFIFINLNVKTVNELQNHNIYVEIQ